MDLLSRDYSAGYFSPLGAGASATGMDNERGLTWTARRRDWRLWVDLTARPAPRWRHRFRFDGLATMYATDSYHARIYQYEPELPPAVSIRPVYGTSVRLVAVAQVQVAVFRLSARCASAASGRRHVAALQVDSTTPGSR